MATMVNSPTVAILEKLHEAPDGLVVEIGRFIEEENINGNGLSTVELASECAQMGRWFLSFNRNPVHIQEAEEKLAHWNWNHPGIVAFADGEDVLDMQVGIAFLFLAGSEEPEETLEQFHAALTRLVPNAIVVVTGAQDYGDWREYGKATALVPVLRRLSIPHEFVKVGDWQMLVVRVP